MEVTWHMIVAAVGATATAIGASVRWLLAWIDKRDKAFLDALEKIQVRLDTERGNRLTDKDEHAQALVVMTERFQGVLERLRSQPPPRSQG